ncbi:hypothetical protein VB737_04670 [Synechococcus sp. BA-120 BA3]|nr:hypothetical protein [Synechococcus sp. BA-120 BA3]
MPSDPYSGPASGALLSCLGFPGWGGLHLVVPSRGQPPALATRLELCQQGEGTTGGQLLPALLRRHRDLEPLDPARWPWAGESAMAWPRSWGHRYLLICRWGSATPLRIAAWQRQGEEGGWVRLCGPVPLSCFSERFLTPGVVRK